MKTLICMIVDESSSMRGSEMEVVAGYNAFLSEQKLVNEEATLTLIKLTKLTLTKFNRNVNTVFKNLPLKSAPLLKADSYRPSRYTALYDAIGDGIAAIDRCKRGQDRVIIVIITDGENNYSLRYTKEEVKELIADRTARGDWSFIYIGEFAQRFAKKMGISPKNAMDFCHEKGKVKANFDAASVACSSLRSNKLKASYELLSL